MARMKGPKKTNRYPEEFKIKAVQLAEHPEEGILSRRNLGHVDLHPARDLCLLRISRFRTAGVASRWSLCFVRRAVHGSSHGLRPVPTSGESRVTGVE